MSEPARQSVEMRDFPGLVNTADVRDLPPGTAVVQVNCVSIILGELRVRAGWKPVTFEG